MQGKVRRQCPQITSFFLEREKGEPKQRVELAAFPLTSRAPYHQAKPADNDAHTPRCQNTVQTARVVKHDVKFSVTEDTVTRHTAKTTPSPQALRHSEYTMHLYKILKKTHTHTYKISTMFISQLTLPSKRRAGPSREEGGCSKIR